MQSSRFATALVGFLPSVLAHGFIEFPPLRAGTAGRDANAWCPHCGNGAGICGDGGQWGKESDLLNFARGPVTTLRAGEIAEFSVKITAHHKGFFEFRICDQHLDGSLAEPQRCLNKHLLRRAPLEADCQVNDDRGDCQPLDTRHPERWYLPPGAGTYKMKYEIPADLRCSSCTLQWQWFTANSCIPGEDTGCYWADFADRGWNRADWCGDFCGRCSSLLQANSSSTLGTHSVRGCGEEFRNCADIAVVDAAGEPITVTTPSTSSEAASSGTSQSGSSSSGTSQSASCSAVWGQCGGKGWKGPQCCTAGLSCERQSEWYSQCKPGPVASASQPDVPSVSSTTKTSSTQMPEQSATTAPLEQSRTTSSGEPQPTDTPMDNSEPESEPETEPEAESEEEDEDVSSSMEPAASSMPTNSQCGSCSGCLWSNGFCCTGTSKSACESHAENRWCGPSSQCGSCRGCMKSDGECCMDASKSYCEGFSDNTWCGASPRSLLQRKKQQFLGLGLIQDGASRARGLVDEL